jgi:hypothetical protein
LVDAALAALLDFFATALRAFAAGGLTDATALLRNAVARDDLAGDDLAVVLEDFLRVFLDIRLPFVAFRGSTIVSVRRLSPAIGFLPTAGQV